MVKYLDGSNELLIHEGGRWRGGENAWTGLAVDRPESTHGRQNPSIVRLKGVHEEGI